MGYYKQGTSVLHGSKCSVRGAGKRVLFCSLLAFLFFQLEKLQSSLQNEKTLEYASHGSSPSPSLFSQVAPLFFPIDAATGLIAFPVEVKTVVFDIGARESDYLKALEITRDPSVALILIDPLPSSMIPIEKRAAEYASKEKGPPPRGDLSPKFTDRVFTIRAAMGDEEGVVDFNEGTGPACSSLLEKTSTTGFWCVNSSKKIRVNKFMLKSVLELIPKTLEAIHLKVDAEGADHLVLRGADAAIHRFKTVVIECQERHFENSCIYEEVKECMCKDQGICNVHKTGQGDLINAFFLPLNEEQVAIPDFLKVAQITFDNIVVRRSFARVEHNNN
jgi:FkbM family methyltransferase